LLWTVNPSPQRWIPLRNLARRHVKTA
jgi:hypothetical protein